jgi:hypothetical protein
MILALFLAVAVRAQEVIREKTVSQCTDDLARHGFESMNHKKSEKICKDYSQKVINCATELAQAKRLSYSFDSALKDCSRVRSPEPPNNGLNN